MENLKYNFMYDRHLSWKAKGMLNYLIINSGLVFSKKELSSVSKDGYDSTDSGFYELENKGYVISVGQQKDLDGKYTFYKYRLTPKTYQTK